MAQNITIESTVSQNCIFERVFFLVILIMELAKRQARDLMEQTVKPRYGFTESFDLSPRHKSKFMENESFH